MKKSLKAIVSIILCLSMLFASTAVSSYVYAANDNLKINLPPAAKEVFDKFINVSIDVIHRVILVFRHPWCAKEGAEIDMSKFEPWFVDEFEGEMINPIIWTRRYQGVRKGGYWHEGQSFVRDGNLVIRTEYKEDGVFGPGYYTDRIDTSNFYSQKYGYFECRAILPGAQGLWSAFWLSSLNVNDGVPGTQGTEIDIFESPLFYRGLSGRDNNMITSNLHYGGYNLGHRYSNVTVAKANNPYTEYNTYGVEWNEDGYIFYINGKETGRSKFGGVSEVPEYMILSCEVDGVGGKPFYGWSGRIDRNKNGELPAELIVDYVKTYVYKNSDK